MKVVDNVPEVPAFKPLTVVFESQDEIDAVYAVFMHTSIAQAVRDKTSATDLPMVIRDALWAHVNTHKKNNIFNRLVEVIGV